MNYLFQLNKTSFPFSNTFNDCFSKTLSNEGTMILFEMVLQFGVNNR